MRLDNPFIGLAVVWAFTGIILKRYSDYRVIAIAAAAGLLAVAFISFRLFLKK
jgi:hypothetical protein